MSSPYLFYSDLFSKRARIVRGEDVYIYDEYGKRHLDATGGSNASISFGHEAKAAIEAMERGLIVYPGSATADGTAGDLVLLTPPYIITREQKDDLTSMLDESLNASEERHPPQQ